MDDELFVGARVEHIWANTHGTVLRIGKALWPFSENWARVRYDDGFECWNVPDELYVPDRSFT